MPQDLSFPLSHSIPLLSYPTTPAVPPPLLLLQMDLLKRLDWRLRLRWVGVGMVAKGLGELAGG